MARHRKSVCDQRSQIGMVQCHVSDTNAGAERAKKSTAPQARSGSS
jgi:hypothetical protein